MIVLEEESKLTVNTKYRLKVKQFLKDEILPYVADIESFQKVDKSILKLLAEKGFLGATIPKRYQGSGANSQMLGILHEEFGKTYASLENILTVIDMASEVILRGKSEIKNLWLPKIAKGEIVPAFSLTEPNIGSDINSIETIAERYETGFLINGKKKWTTLGSCADIFILFAKYDGIGTAFLVPKDCKGLKINPIQDMLGFRGNMLAELHLTNCYIPQENLIGSGMNTIASIALNQGRFLTAWGALGLAQGAFNKALDYVRERRQFGRLLKEHSSVKQIIAKMGVCIEASRQLCQYAGLLREEGNPEAVKAIIMAKYHSSKTASTVSEQAVQILGAFGCHRDGIVERYYRDAKILELIEGASEVLEIHLGDLIEASHYD